MLYVSPLSSTALLLNVESTYQSGTATLHSSYGKLALTSYGSHGVAVLQSEPESYWTLAAGDLIISADGKSIRTPENLFAILRTTHSPEVKCIVVRVNASFIVSLNVREYREVIPPAAPAPPTPPAA